MTTNRKTEINSRGFARGWHAEQLYRAAKAGGQTMAEAFVLGGLAGNVPAECLKVTAAWTFYKFMDGSLAKFVTNHG